MNSIQNKNSKSMAAFLMNDNLEPATRTLDIVRLVFHFCNFVNLTLGGIAFGVGIGYDLTPINVSRNASIIPVQVGENRGLSGSWFVEVAQCTTILLFAPHVIVVLQY